MANQPVIDKRFALILVIAAIAAVGPFLLAGGKSNVAWVTDIDAAKAKASQLKRPMLLYFTASWCPPCRQMKKHVFPDTEVGKTLNELFVPVMIDVSDRGPVEGRIAAKYSVQGIPTMVITDAKGHVIDEHVGGIGASDFVQWLTENHDKPAKPQ